MKGIVSMMKRYLQKIIFLCLMCGGILLVDINPAVAQVTGGAQEIKWMRVGSLHHWFSNGGAEIEYGRRSRQFLTADQIDGLNWPGQHVLNKGVNVGNALWIGATNFADPVTSKVYSNKVVCSGRLFMYLNSEIFPDQFKLIGRSAHPNVLVDNTNASDREDDDVVDEIDPNLPCDRMLVNTFHTSIGISVKRKVLHLQSNTMTIISYMSTSSRIPVLSTVILQKK